MEELAEIYVTLPDEKDEKNNTVCEVVKAEHLRGNLYRIVSENPDPVNEPWEYQTGDKVRCKRARFDDGTLFMWAYAKVDDEGRIVQYSK